MELKNEKMSELNAIAAYGQTFKSNKASATKKKSDKYPTNVHLGDREF